jgi:uncharacterized protein (UPF0212 family)
MLSYQQKQGLIDSLALLQSLMHHDDEHAEWNIARAHIGRALQNLDYHMLAVRD